MPGTLPPPGPPPPALAKQISTWPKCSIVAAKAASTSFELVMSQAKDFASPPISFNTSTAAAFLENFVREGIDWAHLDIAGVCDSQKHLPYCPSKGGSGLIVRTLHKYLMNAK